jgi:crotonobetainyl-CoA:carnitine CoA-transferase CaiB-like acyl-CoA transferase
VAPCCLRGPSVTRALPLSGVIVVESAGSVATSFAGKLLADMGASVALMPCGDSDTSQILGVDVGDPIGGAYGAYLNESKEHARGEDFDESIRSADIVLLHRGSLTHPSLNPAALVSNYPSLVVTTITPYGTSGPKADWHASDFTLQARGGLSYGVGEGDGPPLPIPGRQAELQGGLVGAIGALLAILARDIDQLGQHVDVSIDDVLSTFFTGYYLPRFIYGGGIPGRRSGRVGSNSPYPNTVLACRDGLVALIAPQLDQWLRFVKLIGSPAWAEEPRYQKRRAMQWEYKNEVDKLIQPFLLERSKEELIAEFVAHRIPFAPLLDGRDLLANAHLEVRSSIRDLVLESGKNVRVPAAPFVVDGQRLSSSDLSAIGRATDDLPVRRQSVQRMPSSATVPDNGDLGALAGLRILDLGTAWAGGMAGRILADFGAEVLKVESSKHLDGSRLGRPIGVDDTDGGDKGQWPEMQPGFHVIARNKLSVGINLQAAGAAELIADLAANCDAVIHNFSTGVMERLGLTEELLRSRNANLIVVGQNIAGSTGPLSGYVGYNTTVGGLSGLFGLIGLEGEEPIGSAEGLFSDIVSALNTVFATAASLVGHRRVSIEISQWEATLALIPEALIAPSIGCPLAPNGMQHWGMAPNGVYESAEPDKWIALTASCTDVWRALCTLIGRPELATDPDLSTDEGRRSDAKRIDAAVSKWADGVNASEAVRLAQAAGVAAEVVNNIEDLYFDEHLRSRDAWVDTQHPLIGFEPLPGVGITLTRTAGSVRTVAPFLGAHTRTVLETVLGYEGSVIDGLDLRGVIECGARDE